MRILSTLPRKRDALIRGTPSRRGNFIQGCEQICDLGLDRRSGGSIYCASFAGPPYMLWKEGVESWVPSVETAITYRETSPGALWINPFPKYRACRWRSLH